MEGGGGHPKKYNNPFPSFSYEKMSKYGAQG